MFCPAHQDNFYYLNQGECPYVYEVDDGENFEEMREAMDLVGIMEDEQLMIFRILAGILHIGNIYIHASGEEESEIDVRNYYVWWSIMCCFIIMIVFINLVKIKIDSSFLEVYSTKCLANSF